MVAKKPCFGGNGRPSTIRRRLTIPCVCGSGRISRTFRGTVRIALGRGFYISGLHAWNRDAAAAVSSKTIQPSRRGPGVWRDRNSSCFDPTMYQCHLATGFLASRFHPCVLRGGCPDIKEQTSTYWPTGTDIDL